MRSPSTARRTYNLQLLCEALGALAVVVGFFLVWLPLGVLCLGAVLIVAGNIQVGGSDADIS